MTLASRLVVRLAFAALVSAGCGTGTHGLPPAPDADQSADEGLLSSEADLPADGGQSTDAEPDGSAATDAEPDGGAATDAASCLGSSGTIPNDLKSCTTSDDCVLITVPACCGADSITALARSVACAIPPLQCGARGCSQSVYPTADDGQNTQNGGIVRARCQANVCQSYVAIDSDAGGCGGHTCGSLTELCVHPPLSIGGPAPVCSPADEAGACPPGETYTSSCANQTPTGSGCRYVYVPPPPSCKSIPGSCLSTVDCTCLGNAICGGGANICGSVKASDVQCINVAP
jgi:hypothetical protein